MSDLTKHTLTINISDRIEWIDKRCGLTDIQKDYVTAQMKEAVNDAVQQANDVIKPHEKALPMCGVVLRSEQLLAYHKWYLENRGTVTNSSPEAMVKMYLS